MTAEPPAGADDVVQHLSWVRRLALALVRDPDLADDLAQQAATDWMGSSGGWTARRGGLRAWLAKAARSLAIDRGRAERARRRREGEVAAASQPVERPDEVAARLEQQRRVVLMVQQLPEPYRTTIVHRYLDEWPTAAIAGRMGVPEATVRKRIERGLGLLRERLDGPSGGNARRWCLGLLEPSLRRQVEFGSAGGGLSAVGLGVGIMGSKALAGSVAAVVAAGLAVWFWIGSGELDAPVEAGGRGVVVPAAVAAAREEAVRAAVPAPGSPPRGAEDAASAPLRVHGFLFVDGEHRAPRDLKIQANYDTGDIHWDVAAATWSVDLAALAARGVGTAAMREGATTLWITSSTTVPAQVPIPAELLDAGGVFDLHLTGGRTLALQFLDEQTRAPLPDLAFAVRRTLELSRGAGRVFSRGDESVHRTDAGGRALVQGIPELGQVSVVVDFVPRERQLLMRGGQVATVHWPAQPVWSMPLDATLPKQLEATLFVSAPLGDAVANGQVPAWAIEPGSPPTSVRVVMRERAKVGTDASGLGERYVLPVDGQGGFQLVAGAPSRHVVWLERASDGNPLSLPTEVGFERAGPQPAIVFTPLAVSRLALRCDNVPATGVLEIVGEDGVGAGQPQRHACAGKPFTVEVPAAAGTSLRFSLFDAGSADRKTAWTRRVVVDAGTPRELVLDLAGSWRSIELRAEGLDVATLRALALHPCRAGRVVQDERIVAVCDGGGATASVHVAPGQWLCMAEVDGALRILGVVDVPAGTAGRLVLSPRLVRLPADPLRPAFRLDAVDGVSLFDLPERQRTVQVPADATDVLVPAGAVPVRLPQ